MTLTVIKQKGKVKLWVDYLEAIYTVLKLDGHVIVFPVSFIVDTEFKVYNKWRLLQVFFACLWIAMAASLLT
jgi:hypothetical protein